MPFNLQSTYEPAGDQPSAILQLTNGILSGERYQTCLLYTSGICRTPSDIYYRISFLKSESQNLQLSSILATNDSTNESLALLRQNFEEQGQFLALAEEYSTAYYIVEKYTDLVLRLLKTSYMTGFLKSRIGWQSSFHKLVHKYTAVSLTKIHSSLGNFT